MRNKSVFALAFALLAGAYLALSLSLSPRHLDPDRFYHFGLSRIMVESGTWIPRSLPQVEDLGWGNYFPDKEFLFHQVTRMGYKLGGERGVELAAQACGLGAFFLLLLFAWSRLPPAAATGIAALTFFQAFLFFRLALLRPQVLAIFCFTLLNFALLSGRLYLTVFAAALFTLSYHAFYVPLACLALLGGLSCLLLEGEKRDGWIKLAALGAFGCVVGILLNPYFPSNVEMGLIHARISGLMSNPETGLVFGEELLPTKGRELLVLFDFPLLALVLAAFAFGHIRARKRLDPERELLLWFLLGTNFLFLLLTFTMKRAGEYLIPSTGFLLVLLAEEVPAWTRSRLALLASLVAAQLGYFGYQYQVEQARTNDIKGRAARATLEAIPAEPKGGKVFNCEWDYTPHLLYSRPDLRFLDILDPSLLYFGNSPAYAARFNLKKGLVGDALGLVRNAFHADYVMCADAEIVDQLRNDPGFVQLYPSPSQPFPALLHTIYLFRAEKEPAPQYVRSLEAPLLGLVPASQLAAQVPGTWKGAARPLELERSPYLNLEAAYWEKNPKAELGGEQDMHCAALSPAPSELNRLAGAQWLALGGGPGFKVWRNGKPLFRSPKALIRTRSVQVLVPLDPPLRKDDKIEVLDCASAQARTSYWGIAISLWKKAELDALCARKGIRADAAAAGWPRIGMQAETCIGPVAAPAP